MKFEDKKEIYGSIKKEYNPVLLPGETFNLDFKDIEIYLPLDFLLMTNRTLDDIKYYVDGKEYTIFANENQKEDVGKFWRLSVTAGANPINAGDLRIIVRKQPMTQDLKAQKDFLNEKKSKLKKFLRW